MQHAGAYPAGPLVWQGNPGTSAVAQHRSLRKKPGRDPWEAKISVEANERSAAGCSVYPLYSFVYEEGQGFFYDDQWHHVVVVVGLDFNRIYIDGAQVSGRYVNGTAANLGPNAGGFMWTEPSRPTVQVVELGRNIDSPDNSSHLLGAIDDVRIYGRALTDQEVVDLYEEVGVVCEPQPASQGYWHRQCLGVPAAEGGIDPGRNGRGPQSPTEPGFVPDLMKCGFMSLEDLGFFAMETCEGMDADPPSDPCEKAEKQLTALVFNVCSDRLQEGCEVDVAAQACLSTTVGELLVESAGLIQAGFCDQAAACVAAVNEGEASVGGGSADELRGTDQPRGGALRRLQGKRPGR